MREQRDGSFPWNTNLIFIQVHGFLTVSGDKDDKPLMQNKEIYSSTQETFYNYTLSKNNNRKRNKKPGGQIVMWRDSNWKGKATVMGEICREGECCRTFSWNVFLKTWDPSRTSIA